MTVLVAVAAGALTVWMAWRGYRRGAVATLLAWLPALVSVCVLLPMAWVPWELPGYLLLVCAAGCTAALAYAATFLIVRRRRPEPSAGEPRRLTGGNQIVGAALGTVYAAVLCLGLACVVSAVSFGLVLSAEDAAAPIRPGGWRARAREACFQMADLAHLGVLRYVPVIRTASRELRALVVILNAPPKRLAVLAEKRGLTRLAELPAMKEALSDRHYLDLIAGVGRGDVSALPELARSPITRRILACPEIRRLTRLLRPSDLVRDLERVPDGTPRRSPK